MNLELTSVDLNLVLRTEVCLTGDSIGSAVGTESWEDFITADSVDSENRNGLASLRRGRCYPVIFEERCAKILAILNEILDVRLKISSVGLK